MDLAPDFRDLLAELAAAGAEYVLVGGYAVAYHGRPRSTKDLDIVLEGSPENLRRTAEALRVFGAAPSIAANVADLGTTDVVFMGEPPMRVDFLRTIDGVETKELFERAVTDVLDGVTVRFISFEDLIANKKSVGRPKDIEDVTFLERVRAQRARNAK